MTMNKRRPRKGGIESETAILGIRARESRLVALSTKSESVPGLLSHPPSSIFANTPHCSLSTLIDFAPAGTGVL